MKNIILYNMIFLVSYGVHIRSVMSAGKENIMPEHIFFPVAAYLFLFLFIFFAKKVFKESSAVWMKKLFPSMSVFLLFLLTPFFLTISLPEPHDFIERKILIVLGAVYALNITALFSIMVFYILKRRLFEKTDKKKTVLCLFFLFLMFYSGISVWFNRANEPAGDEPVYLLLAHSIIYDRDLDLKNNYENADYKSFYGRKLKPQGSDIEKDEKLFTYHPVLISFMAAPFYLAGGFWGVSVFMNVLCALFVVMIFIFLNNIFPEKRVCLYAAGITGLTLPVLSYINSLSTEIAGGIFLLLSFMMLKKERKVWLFSFAMAAIVWLHLRIMPVFAGLALLYIFYNRKKAVNIIKFLFVQTVSMGAYFLFNYRLFGVFIPSYAGGGRETIDLMHFSVIQGAAAFLIDRQLGLFIYAPVFILMFAGGYFLWREKKRIFLELLIITVPYIILITSWNDWGGNNAAPRYFVPVIFVFSAALAAGMYFLKDGFSKAVFKITVPVSFGMSCLIIAIPWFRWDKFPADNWIFYIVSEFTGMNISGIFPSFRIEGETGLFTTLVWIFSIVAVNIYAIFKNKNQQ